MRPSYPQFKETVLIDPTSPVIEPFLYYYDKNQHHISGLHFSIDTELNNWHVSLENNINTNIITADHSFMVDCADNNMKYHLVVITTETNTAAIIEVNNVLRMELNHPATKYLYDITDFVHSGENYIYTACLNRQLTQRNMHCFQADCCFLESYILKENTGQ